MENILKKMTYGYYVLTSLKSGDELKSRDEDYIVAGTVNWASQVSFKPATIAVAVGQDSDLNETIDYSKHFTLHLLGENQKELVKKFAKKSEVEDGKINGVSFKKKDGEVILENTLGYITCKIDKNKSVNVGDHTVYFGEVVNHKTLSENKALCTMMLDIEYTEDKVEA